ncbi:MAG: tetratricopeptide repeat protein [Ardenticatenaceae bacterium]|nr:tetratricopeptide repeat protein [Ardenticatenaceae bacterium]
MPDSIHTGDIKDSKGVAIGPGAKAEVTEIHQHFPDAPAYKAPSLPPQGELPDAGGLPPGSRAVHGRNPQFTGRERELLDLAATLLYNGAENTAVISPAIASGMGGIGKTQLAVEFMYRYGRFFPGGVYWISFNDPDAIGGEIAACVGALPPAQQASFHTLDQPTQERLVRAAWQQPILRLLIFDNLDDEQAVRLLETYRPKTGGCRLLVTSRRDTWPPALGRVQPLRTLPRPDSIALLQQLIHPASSHPPALDPNLGAIAEALGDLPLALHMAGSYLRQYRRTVPPAAYLAKLNNPDLLSHPSLTGKNLEYSPTGHELHVAQTFALSYERLNAADPTDGLALALLVRLAYFSPAQVAPLPLWVGSLRSEPLADTALDDPAVDDALRRLSALGLLEQDAAGVGALLHRLIAAFVRGQPAAGDPQADVEQTLYNEASRLNKAGYPRELLPWQPHLRHVADAAVARESGKAANLCNELGYHIRAVGDSAGARPFYERALAIREKALGPDHPDTALSLNNLGALLDSMGDLPAARPFYERALAIREKALGPDHPDTAQSLNNLGYLLRAMGDLPAARPFYERALAIDEKALGPDHPDTASDLNNLGGLLQAMGDLAGARPFYERALAIREKALGPDHPATARSLNNFGGLLQAMGDLAGARPFFERALAIREKALGPDHPATANSLNNLAILAYYEEDFAEAARLMRQALAILEKRLGPDHPNTVGSRESLAAIEAKISS